MNTITNGQIETAYQRLYIAIDATYRATEARIDVELDLEADRLAALKDGRITGKNATEREANARALFADQYAVLEMEQADEREAQHEKQLAALQVEKTRLLMRLAEMNGEAKHE